ncbi:MAG: glycosyltransferase family 4 protein [Coxiellaceae bacterium]|nr:glycosyltransferase family 4 protein [Coxiellaceae bacterium]
MKALLYLPVKKRFLPFWEYYQVEYDTLSELFYEVLICTSICQVLKHCWRADLIYCWWWHRSLPVIIIGKILCIKTFVTGAIHMFDLSGGPSFYNSSIIYRLCIRLGLALCDKSMFISRDQFKQVTSHLYVKSPVVLLSSLSKSASVALSTVMNDREAIRNNSFDNNKGLNFVTTSWHVLSSYRRKGILEVLEALALFKKNTNYKFRWFIIGADGPGIRELNLRINELELTKNVILKIDLPNREKNLLYLTADLYLQPSYCEGFGNAVLEAMGCGVPVLVSRYTAQPEVAGNVGFIVMEITPEAIYQKIMEFMHLDERQLKQLRQNILDFVKARFILDKKVLVFRKAMLELGIKADY